MAAGLGFKTFTTGEVLTAADTNGYLMQGMLVFASAAARNAAITSPQEGQFAYLKDTNVTTYYSGSAWVDLVSASAATFVGARVYGSAVQSIPTSTYPMLTWNTESYDTDSFHDTSTNTSRFTIPAGKAGKYLFVLKTEFASSNNTGNRALYFYKNGSEILEGNFSLSTRGNLQMCLTTVQSAAVADYFEMGVFQSSGISLDIDKTLFYSEYSLSYLGA